MKKKVPKYQQDIASAQAISGKTQISRDEWWSRLAQSHTLAEISEVVNTPTMSADTDQDTTKTDDE